MIGGELKILLHHDIHIDAQHIVIFIACDRFFLYTHLISIKCLRFPAQYRQQAKEDA